MEPTNNEYINFYYKVAKLDAVFKTKGYTTNKASSRALFAEYLEAAKTSHLRAEKLVSQVFKQVFGYELKTISTKKMRTLNYLDTFVTLLKCEKTGLFFTVVTSDVYDLIEDEASEVIVYYSSYQY